MTTTKFFALAALLAAIAILQAGTLKFGPFRWRRSLVPLLAFVVSAAEVAIAFGFLKLGLSPWHVAVALGALLCVAGVIILKQSLARTKVAASTVMAFVGAVQVLTALHVVNLS